MLLPYFGFLWILAITHGAQQTCQPKQMISMQVGYEDLADLAWLDTTLLNLYLRTFSTIKYPHTPII